MTRWAEFRVDAHSIEPVVMTSGEHSRNRASTLPFITGSALRGALAARWLRDSGHYPGPGRTPAPIGDPAVRAGFLEVFESGAVRFPFLFGSGLPPLPLSLHVCKADATHRPVDLVGPAYRDPEKVVCPVRDCGHPVDRVGPKGPDGSRGPLSEVRTRTAVAAQGTAATAMLYAQEELCEGQVFAGVLRARPDVAARLGEWVPVGRPVQVVVGADRSTGGLVDLAITPKAASGPALAERRAAWRARGADELVLTARSPLLLADGWLRPARRFDPATLAGLLGFGPIEVVPGRTMARVRQAAGWNPAAGLPKPVDTALVEGSVATLRLPPGTDHDGLADRLARIEDEGVGWRRAEGFGDVMFWDPRHLDPEGSLG